MMLHEESSVHDQTSNLTIEHNHDNNRETYLLSSTVIEQKLLDIFSKLLPKRSSSFNVHDNFFECGGDSMTAIELVCEARMQGIKINVNQVLQYPTITGLANIASTTTTKDLVYNDEPITTTKALSLLPNQSSYAFTKSMTICTYLLKPRFLLDKKQLEAAVQSIIQRHEALRIRFVSKDLQWQQLIDPYIAVPIVKHIVLDNALTDEERHRTIHDHYEKLLLTIDVEDNQPALRAALFEWGHEQLFFLAIDHYSFDDLSMKLFWNELQMAYFDKSLPLIEMSYSNIIDNLYQLAKDWDFSKEQAFWMKQHAKIKYVPKKSTDNFSINGGIKARIFTIQEEWIEALIKGNPETTKIQTHDILLTAWIQALSLWSGLPGVVQILGSHNRELLDGIAQTMGCFVTAFPVYLEAPPETDIRQAVDSIRNQIKQVPHKGMRYMLSIMIDPKWKEMIFNSPQPSFGFNYLGQEELKQGMWQAFPQEIKGKLVSTSKGTLLSGRHQSGGIPYLILHCQLGIDSKSIILTCDYDSDHYDEVALEKLLTLYQRKIQEFACQLNNIEGDIQ